MNTKLKPYNSPDTVLVLTSFPNPSDSQMGNASFNAVGWHSQKTLKELAKYNKVLVLAEKSVVSPARQVLLHQASAGGRSVSRSSAPKSSRQARTINMFKPSRNLLVARVWEKGNILSLSLLLKRILELSKVSSIFVQFEFNVFGGIIPNVFVLLMLGILKLLGKQVTFELHQVITDISLLQKHIFIKNKFLQLFFNIGLKVFYTLLGLVSNRVVVFEEELKVRLSRFVPASKITVLSLSVEKGKIIQKKNARKALGIPQKEFVVMVFGFINGYKGIDWILNQFKVQSEKLKVNKVRLLIAGGRNPYHVGKPEYEAFYNHIVTEASKYPHITHTGFIPEKNVSKYFAASDLVVLPYEVFMSASGPFSLALSYKKPMLLSSVLKDYSKSQDFKQALAVCELSQKDIFFDLSKKSFRSLLSKAKTNKTYYQKLLDFSTTLAELRSSTYVVKQLAELLTPTPARVATNTQAFIFDTVK